MAFDFPTSPALDQVYAAHGVSYRWNGYAWVMIAATSGPYVLKAGDTMGGELQLIGANSISYQSPGAGFWLATNTTPDRFFVGTDVSGDAFRIFCPAGNAISIDGSTALVNFSGDVNIVGGFTVAGQLTTEGVPGTINIVLTTPSTAPSTGALVVSGGVGIGGDLHVGGTSINVGSNFSGIASAGSYLSLLGPAGSSQTRIIFGKDGDSYWQADSALIRTQTGAVPIASFNAAKVEIYPATASTSTTTGALVVAGGVGIGGVLNVASNLYISGGYYFGPKVFATNDGTYVRLFDDDGLAGLVMGDASAPANFYQNNIHNWIDRASVAQMTLSNGKLDIAFSTASSSTTTGALVVAGGVGISGALHAGADIRAVGHLACGISSASGFLLFGNTGTASISFSSGNYVIDGGAWLVNNANITVGQNGTIGNLYFGNTGTKCLNYDGANFSLIGGPLFLTEGSVTTFIQAFNTFSEARFGTTSSHPVAFFTASTERASLSAAGVWTFKIDRALRFDNQTSAAAAQTGTLTNAPAAGNPTHWLKVNIGGTNFAIPCWPG